MQSIIASDKSRLGKCTHCTAWLGGEGERQLEEARNEDERWLAWVISTLEEMRLASSSSSWLRWEPFFVNLATCLKEQKGYLKFAQLTGFERSLFYRWPGWPNKPRSHTLSHSYFPSLETILECCYACEITPLQVMMNQLEPLRDLIQGKKAAQPLRPRRSAPKRIDRQECLALIQAILDGEEEPLSIRQLAKRLGCRERALTRHFPQECMFIAKRAQEYHKQRQEQRLQQVQDQVRQTVIALHEQGIFPSHRRLRMMLPTGILRMPEANVAWHAALREVGLEQ